MRIIDKSDDRKSSTRAFCAQRAAVWCEAVAEATLEIHSASFASNVRRLGISKLQRVAPLRA